MAFYHLCQATATTGKKKKEEELHIIQKFNNQIQINKNNNREKEREIGTSRPAPSLQRALIPSVLP